MTTIALYPETIQQNDWKKEYKLAKQKLHKSTIYSNIRLKVELINLFEFNQFFTNQLSSNGYCKIPFDHIVLPDNICQIIKSNCKTKTDSNFIPVEFFFDRKSIYNREIIINEFILRIGKIMGFMPELEFIKLTQYVSEELCSFTPFVNLTKSNTIESMENFISDITNNITIIDSRDYKNILLFNEHFVFIMTDDYILFYPKSVNEIKNYYLIIGGKIYLKAWDGYLLF